MIDAKLVAELRERTGAGIMDAKRALEETAGDMEKAIDELRKKGGTKAAKKADRETNEGRVEAYIHSNGKIGSLVEVTCETDFVARTDAFIAFCREIAMHIAAAAPIYLNREQVPAEVLEKEKTIYREEMATQDKPAEVMEKIIEGKLNKFFSETCFMEQLFIKDDEKTMTQFLQEQISTIGENIQVKGFSRFQIG